MVSCKGYLERGREGKGERLNSQLRNFNFQYLELKFILGFLRFYSIIVCAFMKNPIYPANKEKGIEETYCL